MEPLFGIVFDLAAFLAVFTVVVFVHEFGHYWVARRCGVRVVVFSIGFGRELFGWTDRAETRWRVCLVPLGGYVRFFGDADPSSRVSQLLDKATEAERAVSFHHKSLLQRTAIVAAGPAANFALSIVLLSLLFVAVGRPVTPAVIHELAPGGAAEEVGLAPGDRIVELFGKRIDTFEEMRDIVLINPEVTMTAVAMREGRRIEFSITPRVREETDSLGNVHRIGAIGVIVDETVHRRLDPFSAVFAAVGDTYTLVAQNLYALGQIIGGTRDSSELGGPIFIAQMSGAVAEAGLVTMINFIVILSSMLGLINLFPIPLLDGGHLAFYAAEAVRGRPLPARTQHYGYIVGLVMVAALMIMVTYNDLTRPSIVEFFQKLVG